MNETPFADRLIKTVAPVIQTPDEDFFLGAVLGLCAAHQQNQLYAAVCRQGALQLMDRLGLAKPRFSAHLLPQDMLIHGQPCGPGISLRCVTGEAYTLELYLRRADRPAVMMDLLSRVLLMEREPCLSGPHGPDEHVRFNSALVDNLDQRMWSSSTDDLGLEPLFRRIGQYLLDGAFVPSLSDLGWTVPPLTAVV